MSNLSWNQLLGPEKTLDYFQDILMHLRKQYRLGIKVYPPKDMIFNALRLTHFLDTKVVILGQDPYHGPNQANGLAFSVSKGVSLPPSLKNIFQAIAYDLPDFKMPKHGCLESWAKQGVLLLNTTLTVESGQANSHAGLGWTRFTDQIITQLNTHHPDPLVFLLWGQPAQRKRSLITQSRHLILTTSHPSPLSAHRGFLTCRHFSQTNQFLQAHQRVPIQWTIPEAFTVNNI